MMSHEAAAIYGELDKAKRHIWDVLKQHYPTVPTKVLDPCTQALDALTEAEYLIETATGWRRR